MTDAPPKAPSGCGKPARGAAGQGSVVIAIDGAAGTGKGTLGQRLAAHLGFAYLDTGLLYRAVGHAMLEAGRDQDDPAEAAKTAEKLDVFAVDSPAIRTEEVGKAASKAAAIPSVRAALLEFQRKFAARPPNGSRGAILDGRDIGTVICPEADVKLYLDATLDRRVERRVKQLRQRGLPAIPSAVRQDMQDRDARDASRAVAPLKPAADAHLLDTTDLDADAVFERALSLIRDALVADRETAPKSG